jgi:hypothetical protein
MRKPVAFCTFMGTHPTPKGGKRKRMIQKRRTFLSGKAAHLNIPHGRHGKTDYGVRQIKKNTFIKSPLTFWLLTLVHNTLLAAHGFFWHRNTCEMLELTFFCNLGHCRNLSNSIRALETSIKISSLFAKVVPESVFDLTMICLTRVKSYSPRVSHLVLDLECRQGTSRQSNRK